MRHLACAGSLDGFIAESVSWESTKKYHKAGKFLLFSNSSVANSDFKITYLYKGEKMNGTRSCLLFSAHSQPPQELFHV